MKIALVIDDGLDRPDGVQQYVHNLQTQFTATGHEVHIICSASASADPRVHVIGRNTKVNFNGNGLRTPLPVSRTAIREMLERERFDVIHVQTPHSPFFAGRIVDEARRLQARSVRIVATFHILPDGWVSAMGTRALGAVLARNLRRFDAFASETEPAREFARASFGIDSVVIPAGVPIAKYRRDPRRDGQRLRVAFLGRLVERKGALELIAALTRMDPSVRAGLDVRIAGRGPLLAKAEGAVQRGGLQDIVTFAGFVPEQDKPQFLADADIAVFPATGGESFGLVLLEAMAAGAGVVLAGANPGYLAVIGDDPNVSVDATDPAAFAEALTRLATDAGLRDRLHAEQQERVKPFDLPAVCDRIMGELYTAP